MPDQPDEPKRLERASADRQTPKRRELPDPEERGRTYEVMRAHASAETAGERSDATTRSQQDQQADRPAQHGYQDEVARLMGMWADHETRWPTDRRTTADPSADTRSPTLRSSRMTARSTTRTGSSGDLSTTTARPMRACGRTSAGHVLPRSSSGSAATLDQNWSRSAMRRRARSSSISGRSGDRPGSTHSRHCGEPADRCQPRAGAGNPG